MVNTGARDVPPRLGLKDRLPSSTVLVNKNGGGSATICLSMSKNGR